MKYLYNAVNPWWEGKHFDIGIGRDIYAGGLPERLRRNEQIDMLIGGLGVGKTTILKQIKSSQEEPGLLSGKITKFNNNVSIIMFLFIRILG
jgi:hypothetical protein